MESNANTINTALLYIVSLHNYADYEKGILSTHTSVYRIIYQKYQAISCVQIIMRLLCMKFIFNIDNILR